MGTVPHRCRRPDSAGYGNYPSEPAAHPPARQYADGQPYTGESTFPGGCRFSSGSAGARAVIAGDTPNPRGLSGNAFGSLCARCALRKLQRSVLRQSGMFRQKRQPGRVCPVLPPAVQPGRCRRENNRPRQAPALLERPEPKRSAGRPAGCRAPLPSR